MLCIGEGKSLSAAVASGMLMTFHSSQCPKTNGCHFGAIVCIFECRLLCVFTQNSVDVINRLRMAVDGRELVLVFALCL